MVFKLALAALSVSLAAGSAVAQIKPEDAIKFRQSGYTFMAWNMTRIYANVNGTHTSITNHSLSATHKCRKAAEGT